MQPTSAETTARLAPVPSAALPHLRAVAISFAATALVAACAHVSVALPFTPVPIVLSDFAVILIGLLLSPGAAFAAMLLYLLEGALGLPVFSPHGLGGVAQLLGPTGGFLLSYPLVAAAGSFSFRRLRNRLPASLPALIAGAVACGPLFLLGAGWLALLLHLPLTAAIHLAVLPFLGGAGVKVLTAAALVSALSRLRPPSKPA